MNLLQIQPSKGFTLVELVMSMVLLGLIASLMSGMLIQPWVNYEQGSQRLQQVQSINRFLDTLEQDLQNSIPNSIRTHQGATVSQVELFQTQAAMRYRDLGSRKFQPALNSTQLDVLGSYDATLFNDARLVLYNISNGAQVAGEFYYDAINATLATGVGVITPSDLTLTASACVGCTDNTSGVTEIQLSNAWNFVYKNCAPNCLEGSPLGSPSRRIYLTQGAALYQCDLSRGEIRRYEHYTLQTDMANYSPPLGVNLESGLILHNVEQCEFEYLSGSVTQAAILSANIVVKDEFGGTTSLQRQIRIANAP